MTLFEQALVHARASATLKVTKLPCAGMRGEAEAFQAGEPAPGRRGSVRSLRHEFVVVKRETAAASARLLQLNGCRTRFIRSRDPAAASA